jgi:hypothetical protein
MGILSFIHQDVEFSPPDENISLLICFCSRFGRIRKISLYYDGDCYKIDLNSYTQLTDMIELLNITNSESDNDDIILGFLRNRKVSTG